MLYAEIRDPFNANIILKQDSLLIKSSNACIDDCEETLTLIASFYQLEALNGPDTTNVYAFYTDDEEVMKEHFYKLNLSKNLPPNHEPKKEPI